MPPPPKHIPHNIERTTLQKMSHTEGRPSKGCNRPENRPSPVAHAEEDRTICRLRRGKVRAKSRCPQYRSRGCNSPRKVLSPFEL
jgi:hypothetical protein